MKKYQSYKSSGVEWVGKIPSSWSLKKIKYLGNIVSGGTPSTDKEEYWNGSIPWLQSGKVQYNFIKSNDVDKYITELGLMKSSTKMVLSNSVLIAITGATCGNIGYLTFDSTVNQSIIGIEPSTSYSPEFIFYFLSSQRHQILYHQSGGAQGGINKDDVKNLFISIPTLDEQNLIVQFLDEKTEVIDKLISLKERKITLIKEQKISLVNQIITKGLNPSVDKKNSGVEWIGEIPKDWDFVKVGHYTNVVRGGSPRPSGDPKYFNGDFIHWITVKEVTSKNGKYITDTDTKLTEEGMKQSRVLESETLVLSNSGATLGVPGILKIRGCINDGVVSFLKISPLVSRDYLYYFFTTQTSILLKQQSGYGQPNLNIDIVSNIRFPLPSILEQNKIVEYLDLKIIEIDDLVQLEQKKIDLLKEYRQSLISEVVTGKIKVTTDE
jgi:type I restriction enzyme S subunit